MIRLASSTSSETLTGRTGPCQSGIVPFSQQRILVAEQPQAAGRTDADGSGGDDTAILAVRIGTGVCSIM